MPLVTILVPHYNNPNILAPCLESLARLEPSSPNHEIVVVDDGSTDDSVVWIRENHPGISVVECGENRGFVGAVRKGIESTTGEILVFLNNDTRAEPDWLTQLVNPLIEGEVSGATGSVLTDWTGERALFKGGSVNYLGFGFEDQGELPDPESSPIPLLFVCGGAMAISRKTYDQCGGFDETYGSIYEDLDLGWRLNLLGYDCCLVPGSRVAHRAHTSLGRESFERKARFYLGNSIRTVFKNADEKDHLKRIELVVTLAQARERVCLLGENLEAGFWDRIGSVFGARPSTPLVDSIVREEERTRSLASKRAVIQAAKKVSSRDLFRRFVPNPTRGWFYDQEQNRLMEDKGYWKYEQKMYERYGLA